MECRLKPHSSASGTLPVHVDVSVSRHGSILSLDFALRGDNRDVLLPESSESAFRDGLWQHTCFEAFIRPDGGESYVEVNLSLSNEWAAYAFDRYREGLRPLLDVPDPEIFGLRDEGMVELLAKVDLGTALGVADGRSWKIGLSAVIEETSGIRSYWALAHPPGDPDFHHRDCFALELPPPERG